MTERKFLAVCNGPDSQVIAIPEHELVRYQKMYGDLIVGEFTTFDAAMRVVQLGLQGWRRYPSTLSTVDNVLTRDAGRTH
jgi:hypothetical protein